MASSAYKGPVCYQDGWHYTVVKDSAKSAEFPDGHDVPGEKLYMEDDGTFRLAAGGDLSHHERHHQKFLPMELT